MQRFRLATLLAVSTLALAACGGNGSSVVNTGVSAQDAQVRFLNAAPDLATINYLFWPSSGTRPTTPAASNFAYGAITAFAGYSVGTYNFEVDNPSSGTTDLPVCSIPTLNGGQNYTIVVAGSGANHTCLVFNDEAYTNTGAARLHHASPALNATGVSNISWGADANGVPATTLISTTSYPASATTVEPVVPVGDVVSSQGTGVVEYSVGPSPGNATTPTAGSPLTPTYNVQASSAIVGGTQPPTQPDTTGAIPPIGVTNYTGVSLFAIDCVTAPTGASPCVGGTTVLAVFDNK
ncbi:MAG TPA: DUF4397 domain-containing protein [Candidatus Sulfotelmatobacter sp.]|nr:DUF4397 domain-containing protein [Candidatus Sulfotelmatobacter sp.]